MCQKYKSSYCLVTVSSCCLSSLNQHKALPVWLTEELFKILRNSSFQFDNLPVHRRRIKIAAAAEPSCRYTSCYSRSGPHRWSERLLKIQAHMRRVGGLCLFFIWKGYTVLIIMLSCRKNASESPLALTIEMFQLAFARVVHACVCLWVCNFYTRQKGSRSLSWVNRSLICSVAPAASQANTHTGTSTWRMPGWHKLRSQWDGAGDRDCTRTVSIRGPQQQRCSLLSMCLFTVNFKQFHLNNHIFLLQHVR